MSKDNPADCVSRGLLPSELTGHQLYWNVPIFLREPEQFWPSFFLTLAPLTALSDLRQNTVQSLTTQLVKSTHDDTTSDVEDWVAHFSSHPRLLRVVARMLRLRQLSICSSTQGMSESLSHAELNQTLEAVVLHVQHMYFPGIASKLSSGNVTMMPKYL